MNWLHVDTLVSDVQEAIDAHNRHNVLNLDLFAAGNHALLTQLLQPRLVELVVDSVLCEDVVFEYQLIEVVLI
jgi:hypothetical protein